jgi:glycogen operon protein
LITAHDGFTLRDLFSYNHKQNNQPWPYGPSDGGEDNNRSWDQGGDPEMQRQLTRTALMTLLLSAGTPHLTGGDEFYRTQRGNNNPWNLDSMGNYLQWDTLGENIQLQKFVQFLLQFRKRHPVLRPATFYKGRDMNGNGLKDMTWYSANGKEMTPAGFDRTNGFIAYRLDASEVSKSQVRSIFVALNSEFKDVKVTLPPPAAGYAWHRVADTAAWFEADGNFHPEGQEPKIGREYNMHERCELLLIEKRVNLKQTN